MAKKNKNIPVVQTPVSALTQNSCVAFLRKLLPLVTGWLCFLVSISFFTLTFDSAFVKRTLFQIGTVVLATLWGALKLTERAHPFTKKKLILLLPFALYGIWQLISFLCFPYKTAALEEMVRLVLYGLIIALVTCEFTEKDVRIVTRFIIAAAWVSIGYGLVQIVSIWLPWADPMPWRGFFGHRIFSTHANPNFFADFVLFSSCIIGADYFISRKKSRLVLLAIALLTLIFSETKGAWLAYAGTLVVGAALFTNFFFKGTQKQVRLINLAALVVLIGAVACTVFYSAKRFQSVTFRTHTWHATWEMIKDSPVLGTGPGSFKVIYPKYRHPQIFYIENAHNNETQHAENEYLEQWATGGTVGFLLFLGMFGFLFYRVFRALKSTTGPTRIYLAGYGCAVVGMLLHAGVDISIHFVSSGFLLSVFIGILLALCSQQCPPAPKPDTKENMFLKIFQLAVGTLLVAVAIYYTTCFYKMMHTMVLRSAGDWILAVCAWGGWIFCVGGISYIYCKTIYLTRRICVTLLLAVSLLPIYVFFRAFEGNHYYSVGVALIRMGSVDGALDYFTKAIHANPLQYEYRQYRGNVLGSRLDLTQTFSPLSGDKEKSSNDYERALKDFGIVLEKTPYHAQIHYDTAQLYYKMGVRQVEAAQTATTPQQYQQYQQLAAENFEQAKRALQLSLRLDPVNVNAYILLTSMALMAHDIPTAQHWIDTYRNGPENVTEEEFLSRHKNNAQIDYLQQQLYDLQKRLEKK